MPLPQPLRLPEQLSAVATGGLNLLRRADTSNEGKETGIGRGKEYCHALVPPPSVAQAARRKAKTKTPRPTEHGARAVTSVPG